ncbi:MAG: PqqD family protein [Wujia sp.]
MQKNKKKDINYLEYVPVHNPKYQSTVEEDGRVTILQEHKGVFYFLTQKLLKKPRFTQIHLDEMGSFIWPLMDGNRTVMEIAQLVKEHFGEKAEPLYNRLVTYMATMESYEFICMHHKS